MGHTRRRATTPARRATKLLHRFSFAFFSRSRVVPVTRSLPFSCSRVVEEWRPTEHSRGPAQGEHTARPAIGDVARNRSYRIQWSMFGPASEVRAADSRLTTPLCR